MDQAVVVGPEQVVTPIIVWGIFIALTLSIDSPLPEERVTFDELVLTMLRDVLPHPMGNGYPAFFGWVDPPPSSAGIPASLAAAPMSPSVVSGDHADIYLERAVVHWAWEQLQPWLPVRCELPVEPLFCVVTGPTRGRRRSAAAVRADLRDTAAAAAVRRRFAPQQPRAPRTRSG